VAATRAELNQWSFDERSTLEAEVLAHGGTMVERFYLRYPTTVLFFAPSIELQAVFVAAQIGRTAKPVDYLVYGNLDTRSVVEALADTLDVNIGIQRARLRKSDLPTSWQLDEKRQFLFRAWRDMHARQTVAGGTVLGFPLAVGNDRPMTFAVWGEDGPIDPAFFFERLRVSSSLTTAEATQWDDLKASVLSQQGKIFKPDLDSSRLTRDPTGVAATDQAFSDYTYPHSVLRIIVDPDTQASAWSALGRRQVDTHLHRVEDLATLRKIQLQTQGQAATEDDLLDGEATTLASNTGLHPFRFMMSDWRNTFQLQALIEFYLGFPMPRDLSANLPSTYPKYELLDLVTIEDSKLICKTTTGKSDLIFVQIDDFRLVGGSIPAYKRHGLILSGSHKGEPWEMLDTYRGMLFVVKAGRIIGAYLFSSFTSRHHKLTQIQKRTSIQGNVVYGFYSVTSVSTPGINYSFLVTRSPTDLKGGKGSLPGLTYFDPGATGVAARTKGSIMIHRGLESKVGTGSEGCQVSPFFYDFRHDLIKAVLDDPVENARIAGCRGNSVPDLEKLARMTEGESKEYYHKVVTQLNQDAAELTQQEEWNDFYDPPTDPARGDGDCECTFDAFNKHYAAVVRALDELAKGAPDDEFVRPPEWNGILYGAYVLIRPDEKHVGWTP